MSKYTKKIEVYKSISKENCVCVDFPHGEAYLRMGVDGIEIINPNTGSYVLSWVDGVDLVA